ncbi:MAG: hypothetical protein AAB305_00895 [Candidatus Zixiibacteriota bacterium]
MRVRPTDPSREAVSRQNDDQIYCDDFSWHFGADEDDSAEPAPFLMITRETVIHNQQQSELHTPQPNQNGTAIEVEDQGIDNNESVFGEDNSIDKRSRRFT